MREEDLEILEEAIRNSGAGEDFDEMLLRANKKHLPRKYNRQFCLMLDEILKEADDLGVSNRSAAQSLARKLGPAGKKPDIAEQLLARQFGPAQALPPVSAPIPRPLEPAPPPEKPAGGESLAEGPAAGETVNAETGEEASEGSVEKLPEEQKILDLGGTHPKSLSPEIQEKLRKLVKAQKRKQAWEEGSQKEEPEPGLFFKGQQRAPPFVPLGRPVKKEEGPAEPEKESADGQDEEDLEKN